MKIAVKNTGDFLNVTHRLDGEYPVEKYGDCVIVDSDTIPLTRIISNGIDGDSMHLNNGAIFIHLPRAKLCAHAMRREAREIAFKPHDDIVAKQIPGDDIPAAKNARAAIRAEYEIIQSDIDNSVDNAGIENVLIAAGIL